MQVVYDLRAPEVLEQRDIWLVAERLIAGEDIMFLIEVLPSLIPRVLAILSRDGPRAHRVWTPKLLRRRFALEMALAMLVPPLDIRVGCTTIEETEKTGDTFRGLVDWIGRVVALVVTPRAAGVVSVIIEGTRTHRGVSGRAPQGRLASGI